MRIHTNELLWRDIRTAATTAGVTLLRDSEHKSRTHKRAFDVILSGNSPYRVHQGQNRRPDEEYFGDEKAASWDQWGIFLSLLFEADADLKTPYYASREEFHWRTSARFDRWDPEETQEHRQHRWEYQGTSAGGQYAVSACKGCDAQQRRLLNMTWDEFQRINA